MNILDAVKNPRRVIFAYGIRGGFRFLDDETYTKLMYRMNVCGIPKKFIAQLKI